MKKIIAITAVAMVSMSLNVVASTISGAWQGAVTFPNATASNDGKQYRMAAMYGPRDAAAAIRSLRQQEEDVRAIRRMRQSGSPFVFLSSAPFNLGEQYQMALQHCSQFRQSAARAPDTRSDGIFTFRCVAY